MTSPVLELRVAERTQQWEEVTVELEQLDLRHPLTGLATGPCSTRGWAPPSANSTWSAIPPAVLLIDLEQRERPEQIPGYYAVLRPLRNRPSPAR